MKKIGILGYGRWGPNYVRSFSSIDDCVVSMICDTNPAMLEKIGNKLGKEIEKVTDSSYIINNTKLEGVIVSTPPGTHYTLATACMEAGKHVLVEKPMVLTSDDARKLIETAEKTGRTIMVGHIHDYNPLVIKLQEEVFSDSLGKIFYADVNMGGNGPVRSDVNALWDWGPHAISVLMKVLGSYPLDVSARGSSFIKNGIDDVVWMTMRFPRDVMAGAKVSWINPVKIREFSFLGDKKYAVADDVAAEGKLKIYDRGPERFGDKLAGDYGEHRLIVRDGDMYSPQVPNGEPLLNEAKEFLAAISEGRKPISDGNKGLQVVRVLEAAQRSLDSNGIAISIEQDGVTE